jgi:Ni,Fe-hydrogenase I cytochrome b subunit
MSAHQNDTTTGIRHKRWVKTSHWMISLSFLVLASTGFVILMAHPRLYWGEAGNDLTPALFELPICRNYQHGGWEKVLPFLIP